MKAQILIFFLSFFICFSLAAQAPDSSLVVYDNSEEILLVGEKIYVFQDKEGKMSINDILKPEVQARFEPNSKKIVQKKDTETFFWIKLTLQNQTEDRIWIELDNAFTRIIEYYAPKDSTYKKLAHTGAMLPDSTKPYPTNVYWLPVLPDSKPQTVYIRIYTQTNLLIPIVVGSLKALHKKKLANDYVFGGFLGLVLIMIGYNLFLYWATNDKVYRIYVLYLLWALFVVPYLCNYQVIVYISPENWKPWLNEYFLVWQNPIFLIITVFTVRFLNLKQRLPKIYYYLLSLSFILSIIIPVALFLGASFSVIFPIFQLVVFVLYLSFLGTGLYLWLRKKDKTAFFYTIAWVWVIGFTFVFLFYVNGLLPYHYFPRNATFWGTSTEILFFSLALGHRINVMRKEKEQAQEQVVEMVKEQNALLENKVQERTLALSQANNDLQVLNEEILQQTEEIITQRDALSQANTEINKQHQDIVSSINYALRIQNAIIPKEIELQKYFDCFVFFRPRDIVSGDFYWFADKGKTKIFAVADCTGHGVSGAFMTMIGNNMLNQIVHDQEIHQPDQILNLMSPLLEKTLLHSEGKVKDGMDISIISIENQNLADFENPQGLKISYAGAMNPLYYVQNQEFREIKADKRPIGGKIDEGFQYKKHEIREQGLGTNETKNASSLNSDSCTLYLCSDGFQDQFGGAYNKKFMVSNFKKLLLEISEKPMKEQKVLLDDAFEAWKGAQKQTDDILVFGIRV